MKKRQKLKADYRRLSDSTDEETELLLRNKAQKRDMPTVEKVVEDGDTLQSIAIRYHCTIEDLKRINNIHKENEIFAKGIIKVPIRPFTLAGVHSDGTCSPTSQDFVNTQTINSDVLNSKLIDNLKHNETNEVNTIIFNSSIVQKTEAEEVHVHDIDDIDEEVKLLPQHAKQTFDPIISTRFNCSGSDGDISLKALILIIIILIFAAPLIYVFYIAEHLEKYHHPHNS